MPHPPPRRPLPRFAAASRRPVRSHLAAFLLAMLALLTMLGAATAQDAASPFRSRLDAIKADLSTVEATLAAPSVDTDTLTKLRDRLDTDLAALSTLQSDVAAPRDAAKARLQKFGDPPKPGEPAESPDITDARKREQALYSDLDGIGRETQVQTVRVDQLTNAIIEKRRDAFTRQITERVSSIIDPTFWTGFAADLPRLVWSIATVTADASNYFALHSAPTSFGTFFGTFAIALLFARMLRRRIARWREALVKRQYQSRRFPASLDTLLGMVRAGLGWPFMALMTVTALKLADLLPLRLLNGWGMGLVGAITLGVLYRAMGEGLLEPERSSLRLLPLSDWAVRRIQRRVLWTAIMLGAYTAALVTGRALYAPVSLTVAITGLASFIFALISISLLMRLRRAPRTLDEEGRPVEDDVNKLDFLRPLLWILTLAIVACLLLGYVALGGFLAFYPPILFFAFALAYTTMTLIDAGLTEGVAGDPERGRAIASAIGVSAKNIAFTATLLSGVLRVVVLLVALLLVSGPLGFYSSDMLSAVQRAFFGFQVGEITISPSSILLGVFLFLVVLVVGRLLRGWVRNTLLPRTTLDAGLQNSIATIIGYAGIILAIAVGLSEVGLSLQNVAIVAGALSVGIGFGLQSIVSNFVSGLILLAERPIRVGDIIAAGGEEGFVRRISVRATEIETYDRATLIVPNSQLITGVVKNWVYGNTWSRVRIVISVGYDADIDAVRAILRAAAEDDPRILPTPPPRVFLSNMGAALDFELIAVVASVETLLAVKSDLYIRILKAFREKGILVAAQLPAAPAPVVVRLDEALAAVEQGRLRLDAARGEAPRPDGTPAQPPQT